MEHHGESKQHKFAIIGTSSAGKTTLTYQVIGKLKELGILVDGVLQQDRRIAFDRIKLETDREAQYWVIFNQLIKECELLLKHGTDVIVSDRSVIDFYAYYETMYGRNEPLYNFLQYWATTYDKLYFLEKLPYHDDGARPPEEFRDRVEETLRVIIKYIPNAVTIPRDLIYTDILKCINRILSPRELALIPSIINEVQVLVGGSYAFNRQTRYSDIDVYIRGNAYSSKIAYAESALRDVFGANFQVRVVPGKAYEYLMSEGFMVLNREEDE